MSQSSKDRKNKLNPGFRSKEIGGLFALCSTLVMQLCHALELQAKTFGDCLANDVGLGHQTSLYWGDTHVHTSLSVDAFSGGNRSLGPEEAYRFAKGERVRSSTGVEAQLSRPLDFLVVADHAGFLGGLNGLVAAELDDLGGGYGKALRSRIERGELRVNGFSERQAVWRNIVRLLDADNTKKSAIWAESLRVAERHNEPGTFTTLLGFEWTPFAADSYASLHRVVVFRDGEDLVRRVLPYSKYDSLEPEDLWDYLRKYEETTGGRVLAIPHNGNLSDGRMFATVDSDGYPLSTDYAKTRARWERLYEVTQMKGDSETHPVLSPQDAFADFETWSWSTGTEQADRPEAEKKQFEYARSALKLGLQQEARLGINPFKFGLIGSTDTHTSLSTADEDNFTGKFPASEPGINRTAVSGWDGWSLSAAGYTGVWSTGNTREELFDAMWRREVYATTGPRISIRFFGGWDFTKEDLRSCSVADTGYVKGVPMGADLLSAPDNRVPSFLIRVVKDPIGYDIELIQVVKGMLGQDGMLLEKVYDVAGASTAKPAGLAPTHKLVSEEQKEGESGFAVSTLVWTDPEFDPGMPAFYYLRVLQLESPRWTAYDIEKFDINDVPDTVPLTTRDRAYSSPIWYSP